jgi:hypothetical protein
MTRTAGTDSGLTTVSLTMDHSHFGSQLGGNNNFEIRSARHLTNIRSFPAYNYRQTRTVNMNADIAAGDQLPTPPPAAPPVLAYGRVINFEPIPNFSGTYIAADNEPYINGDTILRRPRISNLRIVVDSAGRPNIGLFAATNGATIRGLSLYEAHVESTGSTNVGAIAGQMNGGAIRYSYSYATGGLVGHLNTGGTIEQSFNAGFFDKNINTSTGFGSVTGRGGDIGGLVGRNSGTIRNSFNNARVNIIDVEVVPSAGVVDRGLSTNPTNAPLAPGAGGSTYLGGIAGTNLGRIDRTYATNFVAIYDAHPGRSGGIIGRNGDGSTPAPPLLQTPTNSFYLINGCTNVYGIQRTKEALQTEPALVGGATPFRISPNVVSPNEYREGENLYTQYPYPILSTNDTPLTKHLNNNPFGIPPVTGPLPGMNAWGWEDIDTLIIKPVSLVYFERYPGGSYGFGSGAAPRTLRPNRQNPAAGYVQEAGYMLLVEIEEGFNINNLDFYVRAGGTGAWILIPRVFDYTTNDMPAPFNGEFRYAKLSLQALEDALGTNRSLLLEYAVSYNGDPVTGTVESTGYFHPLFANSVTSSATTNNFEVRTPWQMQNIDKISILKPDAPHVRVNAAGSAWAQFFLSTNGNGNRVPGTTGSVATQARDDLAALINSAPTVATAIGTVVPSTTGVEVFPHASLSSSNLPADTNYIVTSGNLEITGPVDLTGIEYLHVSGNLILTGAVTMPELRGAVVTGNLIVNPGANIRGNDTDRIGSSIVVGGLMDVGTASGAVCTIRYCRFYVGGNIRVLRDVAGPGQNMLFGNSVYMTKGSITLGNMTGNNNNISLGTETEFSQFYAETSISIRGQGNYTHHGIFATLGTLTFHNGNNINSGLYVANQIVSQPSGSINQVATTRLTNQTGLNNALNLGLTFTSTTIVPVPVPYPYAGRITFTQTRDMYFDRDVWDSNMGPRPPGGDGTTVSYLVQPATAGSTFAIVEEEFRSIYEGNNNIIFDVNLAGAAVEAYGLFSVNNRIIRNLRHRGNIRWRYSGCKQWKRLTYILCC